MFLNLRQDLHRVVHMETHIILASGSQIRQTLLRQAGIAHEAIAARVDEDAVKSALRADGAAPRDVADALAEMKAVKISEKHPDAMVIGCDQVLGFDKQVLSKPRDRDAACAQLHSLRGKSHELLSAVVIAEAGRAVWREVGSVTLTMRPLSDAWLQSYVTRNWDSIRHSVGGYKIEEEGIRLFSRINGDYFTILGLPILALISYLGLRGMIEQ